MALAPEIVYTKTAKAVLELRNKSLKASRDLTQLLRAIDGKMTVGDLLELTGATMPQLQHALTTLSNDGYIKVVESAQARERPRAQPAVVVPATQATATTAAPAATAPDDDGEDALDFTSPEAMAALNAEAASRALAAQEAE